MQTREGCVGLWEISAPATRIKTTVTQQRICSLAAKTTTVHRQCNLYYKVNGDSNNNLNASPQTLIKIKSTQEVFVSL